MDHADRLLVSELELDPGWAEFLCDTYLRIARESFAPDYVDVITQRWADVLTFGDVYCFVRVHRLVGLG